MNLQGLSEGSTRIFTREFLLKSKVEFCENQPWFYEIFLKDDKGFFLKMNELWFFIVEKPNA